MHNLAEGETLQGLYYVTVRGYQFSTFSVQFHTENEQNETLHKSAVYLNEANPLKGILHTKNDYQSYFFDLPGGHSKTDVEVRLSPVNGIFNYYVGYDARPTSTSFFKRGGHDNGYTVDFEHQSGQTRRYRAGVTRVGCS